VDRSTSAEANAFYTSVVATLYVARTDALAPVFLNELRRLLDDAYNDGFSDDDWDHTIGGIHVWVADRDGLISHASVVERTLVCSGQMLRVGYVEAVATSAARRRQGHGTTVMQRVGDVIRERFALGGLSTGAHGFYEALGWERWRGLTFVDGPLGRQPTPDDDDGIMILRTTRSPHLDLEGDIVCDWRSGDVW
jgi:aminoglycoside 2'-N-acetyltransferase I